MKKVLLLMIGTLLFALVARVLALKVPADQSDPNRILAMWASIPSREIADFLNKAAQMNDQEQALAQTADSKAGDNQALRMLADTISADHQVNQQALEALAGKHEIELQSGSWRKGVLKGTEARLPTLTGSEFDEAYVEREMHRSRESLERFKRAQRRFAGEKALTLYIVQTLPILEAHLKMAENVRREMNLADSQNSMAANH